MRRGEIWRAFLLSRTRAWTSQARVWRDLSNPAVDVCLAGPSDAAETEPALEALRLGPMSDPELAWLRHVGDAAFMPDRPMLQSR